MFSGRFIYLRYRTHLIHINNTFKYGHASVILGNVDVLYSAKMGMNIDQF